MWLEIDLVLFKTKILFVDTITLCGTDRFSAAAWRLITQCFKNCKSSKEFSKNQFFGTCYCLLEIIWQLSSSKWQLTINYIFFTTDLKKNTDITSIWDHRKQNFLFFKELKLGFTKQHGLISWYAHLKDYVMV